MARFRAPTTVYGTVEDVKARTFGDPSPNPENPPATPDASRDRRVTRRNKFSKALAADAKALFEQQLGRPVTDGEARHWLGNLTDMLWLLIDWEAARLTRPRPLPEPASKMDLPEPSDPGIP
jgi:hypothetical protein